MQKIDTTRLTVDPFNTDFMRRWSWVTLGKTLLNAAENHANARGFGTKHLDGHHYSWVLSRLVIDMAQMPEAGQAVEVSTWIENIFHTFTTRDFAVRSGDGRTYGYAQSVWAIIDYDTRQPVPLEAARFQPYLAPEEPCPISRPAHMRPADDADYVVTIPTRFSDIDFNGHVNSIRYVEHILDLFPLETYADGRNLRRLEMAYMTESRYGDTLSFFVRQHDAPTVGTQSAQVAEVEVRKNYLKADKATTQDDSQQGEPIVRARLTFA